jgi:hypothetical protein
LASAAHQSDTCNNLTKNNLTPGTVSARPVGL